MRIIQIPLWWVVALALAVYIGSIHQDLAALVAFALTFGVVFGGGMMAMKPPPRPRVAAPRKRHPLREQRRRTALRREPVVGYGPIPPTDGDE